MNSQARPILVSAIHTEEEFPWDAPLSRENQAVEHAAALTALQSLYDKYKASISYCVDYPISTNSTSVNVINDILNNGHDVELGMHCHPWVTPPHEEEVTQQNSFPGNLPKDLERQKLTQLLAVIENSFNTRPTFYIAGRYGFGPNTANILNGLGIKVDLSICPHYDYTAEGGPDFTGHNHRVHKNTECPDVIHIPHSTGMVGWACDKGAMHPLLSNRAASLTKLPQLASKLGGINRIRLSPEGHNLQELKQLTQALLKSAPHSALVLSFHSPSVVPGNTPYVKTETDKAAFFDTLEGYLDYFQNDLVGEFSTVEAYIRNANLK